MVTPKPVIDISNDDVPSVDIPSRYELPPRSTRDVPPKRYDPEFESHNLGIHLTEEIMKTYRRQQ